MNVFTGIDDDIVWYGAQTRLHIGGIGVRGRWLQLREELTDGTTFSSDLFDVMGLYRFYESPAWHLEFGLGPLGYHDEVGTEWGAVGSIGTNLFLIKPLVFGAEYSGGSINEVAIRQATISAGYGGTGRLRLGYRSTRFEDLKSTEWNWASPIGF